MKVFIWYATQDPSNYGEGKKWAKVYVVAEDLAAARRALDQFLPKQGLNASLFRLVLEQNEPQVYDTPFVEINMSDGHKSAAFVHANKLV